MSYGEHDIIETELDIFREGHYIPEGSSGVIVGVASEKDGAYYVEFCTIIHNPVILSFDHEFTLAVSE
jgi:hypothetical protein